MKRKAGQQENEAGQPHFFHTEEAKRKGERGGEQELVPDYKNQSSTPIDILLPANLHFPEFL